MIETENLKENRTQEEKMKRMRTAVKGVAAWFSYFMGTASLLISIFNPWGLEIMSFSFGIIILSISMFLFYQHLKEKKIEGLFRITRNVKFLGWFLFIPSFIGRNLIDKSENLHHIFNYILILGFIFMLSSIGLKRYAKRQSKINL